MNATELPKSKPILFSTPMVKAILMGEKTKTRRIVTKESVINDPNIVLSYLTDGDCFAHFRGKGNHVDCAGFVSKYKIDDILWVREAWQYSDDLKNPYWYKQHAKEEYLPEYFEKMKWRPSIHMPKEACRLFLKVKSIKVERLQDITDEEAKAEGVETLDFYPGYDISSRGKFEGLWNLINEEIVWDQNPWVWVYEFERIEP